MTITIGLQPMTVSIRAYAKINLFLKIIGPRDDGFTDIFSLMQAVSLSDSLEINKVDSGLSLSSDDPSLPLDSSNTVAKSWAVLCSAIGKELPSRIFIKKSIPSESGLGGGSSDAASALVGLSRLWGLNINKETFEILGSAVGSDVPFFFGGGTSLIEGRGEIVTDIASPLDYALLLVKPPFGMSTRSAYDRVKKILTKSDCKIKIHHLRNSAEIIKLAELGNDLEGPFFEMFPEAEHIKRRLIRSGAAYAGLSGSGSCLFGIFNSLESAEAARAQFQDLWARAVVPVGLSLI